jgi:hypothetical protein
MSGTDATTRRGPPAGRPPLTDSPWFWLLLFANAALVGVALIGPKYNRRQGAIERRYEARQEIARRMQDQPAGQTVTEEAASGDDAVSHDAVADASAHIVPLFPLAVTLVLLNSVAIVLFCVSRVRLAGGPPTNAETPRK